MSTTNEVPAAVSEVRPHKYRGLTPLGALVYFAVVAVLELIVAPFLQGPRFGRAGYFIGESPHFLILFLAYALCPQVFSRRFWHFPSHSWYWLIGIAGLETLVFMLGRPVYGPVTKLLAFEVVVLGPFLEEVVRAVTISPMLDRWSPFWAILVTGLLNTVVHPDPLHVVLPVFLQTIMFVSTDRSIPATALGHALMNGFIVFKSGIL